MSRTVSKQKRRQLTVRFSDRTGDRLENQLKKRDYIKANVYINEALIEKLERDEASEKATAR